MKKINHNVKPGDIFRSMWGYDQTNIDYFQVVKLVGKTMVGIKAINAELVETTGYMQGKVRPVKDSFKVDVLLGGKIDDVFRRRVSNGHLKIDDVRHAYPVRDDEVSHFTSYY